LKSIFTQHCTVAKGGTADVPELRLAVEAQLREEDTPSAQHLLTRLACRGQRLPSCSLCSSTEEMPEKCLFLPEKAGERPALVTLGSQASPRSATEGPLWMEDPSVGSPVAPKSLEVVGTHKLLL